MIGLGVLVATGLACSTSDPGVSRAEIVYEGQCTKASCADLTRPDTDCTDTAPLFTCSDSGGQCAFSYRCPSPDEPNAAVSFSPCDDADCGAKPTTGDEAGCAAGTKFTGATCGKLNNAKTCKWNPGCVVLGAPIPIDASKVGPACGNADAAVCPTGSQCVSLPLETGVEGAHCIADPCALIACPDAKCITSGSYPGSVSCER